ncbi:MAG: EAL domain-containing protein [Salinarimonadaceae bacterium]|nr:MAG: EAL domain-containing protein [Salinarimonadaceae bacterium]
MTKKHRRAIGFVAVLLITATFAALAGTAFFLHVSSQNKERLAELNRQLLHRSEMAIDYAVISLVEAMELGATGCGVESRAEIRRLVFQRSSVKDVHVFGDDGAIQCSAHPDARELGLAPASIGPGEPASNRHVALHALDFEKGRQVGVSWRLPSGAGLLASLNIDALFFDILPPALRDRGEAKLMLGDGGTVVARYAPPQPGWEASKDSMAMGAASARYPLQTVLRIDNAPLQSWNMEAQPVVAAVGGGFGMIFALMLLRALRRTPDPVHEIDAALAAGEFQPYLQPIFSIDDKRIVGCEVLTRWIRQDGTVVTPDRFISLLEENGRIVPMTRAVMRKTLKALRPLISRNAAFKVAFNVTPADLLSADFAAEMTELVTQAGVDTHSVVLELTERQQIPDLGDAARKVASLRSLGFKVALDDTGTGHNGLSYIQTLGADTIKIDKIFVDAIGQNIAGSAIIEMLVSLAAALSMNTVAEGIETEEQRAALRACGVDEGQGYLVSRPLPIEEFISLVARGNAAIVPNKAIAA